MKKLITLVCAALVLGLTVSVSATTWHVPDECLTIQCGIDSASAGDTVLVADGTYTGDESRDIDFKCKAIVVMSEHGREVTIIDCAGDSLNPHRGFYFHSGEGPNSVVQGFTIRNGYADYGGGISCTDSSNPTIISNIISDNSASNGGGGISCTDSSNATIISNIISDNSARWGGGINCAYDSNPTIIDNEIVGNSATDYDGAGVNCWYASPTIMGNSIRSNSAYYGGGGVYMHGSNALVSNNTISANVANSGAGVSSDGSSPGTIVDNVITGNSAVLGGGIECTKSVSIIRNNVIRDNQAEYGGGVFSCTSNDTISYNTVDSCSAAIIGGGMFFTNNSKSMVNNNVVTGCSAVMGAGIGLAEQPCEPFFNEDGYATLDDNIISGNSASLYGGGIACTDTSSPIITDCTISDNIGDGIFCEDSSSPTINGSCVFDNTGCGVKNADSTVTIDIEYNWWGDPSGPGGICIGSGDEVCGFMTCPEHWLSSPTAAELLSFTGIGYNGYVGMEWRTAAEIDNAGFNLHRGLSKEGPYAQINDQLIPAQGSAIEGAAYSFTDEKVTNGVTYYYWLEDVDLDGRNTMHGPVSATPGPSPVEDEEEKAPIPTSFNLAKNYPNPFKPQTTIRYTLPEDTQVSLVVYNVTGQGIATLVNQEQVKGHHECDWDGRGMASGVYFYRLQAGDFVETRRMILLR